MRGKNVVQKDLLWYLIGNIVPLLIGVIKSPLFTRVFSTEEFGAYSLVFLSFSYISIACYSWIASCVWRYYYLYKKEDRIRCLYSNLLFLYIITSFTVFILSWIWYEWSNDMLIRKLIPLCFLQFLTSELLSFFFVRSRLEGRTFHYNLVQILRTSASFGLLLFLTFVWNFRIESFLLSNIALNLLFIVILVVPDCWKLRLSFSLVKVHELRTFLGYGKIGILINLSTAFLISSDRFLIQHFAGLGSVGIYNQNYNIAQISIAMLINVYWAALNPNLMLTLESKAEDMKGKLHSFFSIYFFIFAPVAFYFAIYSHEIAQLMLGLDFRSGFRVIGWTAFAEFVAGLCFLPVSILRFGNCFKRLLMMYILAIIFNVGLNFFLIPIFGYEVAAITTLLANCFLWIAFNSSVKESFLLYLINSKGIFLFPVIFLLQYIVHSFLTFYALPSRCYVLEGIISFSIYLFVAFRQKWINVALLSIETRIETLTD